MPLTSSSTVAEAKAAYFDSADYDTESDVTKCKAFIQACRFLLVMIPKSVQHGGRGSDGMEFDQAEIRQQLDAAKAWLAANDSDFAGGGGDQVIYPDFSDFRRSC